MPWNQPVKIEEDNEYSQRGLLSRFILIKNLPGNILFRGIEPWSFYENEIAWWKSKNKEFFESEYFVLAEDDY